MLSGMKENLRYLPPSFQEAAAAVLMRSWQPGHFLARGLLHVPDQCLRQSAIVGNFRAQAGQKLLLHDFQDLAGFFRGTDAFPLSL